MTAVMRKPSLGAPPPSLITSPSARPIAEALLARTGGHLELAPAGPARRPQLLDRAPHPPDLLLEGGLEGDDDAVGRHGHGAGERALEDAVGVGAQDGAVLERARFALGP